jgi:xanthine dehydrogenase accessory factor
VKAHVTATVVRAQRPTSVRAGDAARVDGDGTITGFVGGVCAEDSVRLHALRCLETGEPLLLRIVPEGDGEAADGAVTVANPCLSGGALEIFLEPHLPAPRVAVTGASPVSVALAELAPRVGFEVCAREPADGDMALVVASHGRDELGALRAALELHLPYVGLVASRTRGAAVLEELGAAGEAVETPAGLDIGARTPEEIALSILARLVAVRRAAVHVPPPPVPVEHHHCEHH